MKMLLRRFIVGCKIVLFSFPLFAFWACGEEVSGIEGGVVDNVDNANKLQQLLVIVRVVDSTGRYVVMERIDSVKLKINGQTWGSFPSAPIDIAGINSIVNGNFNVADEEIGYLVVAKYTIAQDSLETAGQFATYLHNRLRIAPGDYVCEVAEVYFKDIANNVIVRRPRIFKSFTVEANTSGLFLGEINVSLN